MALDNNNTRTEQSHGKVDSLVVTIFLLLHHCSMSFCLVPKIIQRGRSHCRTPRADIPGSACVRLGLAFMRVIFDLDAGAQL